MGAKLKKFFLEDAGPLIWVFNCGLFFNSALNSLFRGQWPMVIFNLLFLALSAVNASGALARRDRQREMARLRGTDAE